MPIDPKKLFPNTPEKKVEPSPKKNSASTFTLFGSKPANSIKMFENEEENRDVVEANPQQYGYRKLAGGPLGNK